jgi:DNA-binding response OmpR family regulator
MIYALMAGRDKRVFSEIETILIDNKIIIQWCDSGNAVLSRLLEKANNLVIVDENLPDMKGRTFVEKLVMKNPMAHCVVASSLSKKNFHDVYEGLGVLMQFPVLPGKKDAHELIKHLQLIFQLQEHNRI